VNDTNFGKKKYIYIAQILFFFIFLTIFFQNISHSREEFSDLLSQIYTELPVKYPSFLSDSTET